MRSPTYGVGIKLKRIAELRARGLSWEAIGRELDIKVSRIKRWTRVHGHIWRRFLVAATRQVESDSVAEAITVLRSLLRAKDDKLRSIVGRALLGLREKRRAPEEPIVIEAVEEMSRVTHFLESHTPQQVRGILEAAVEKSG